MQSTRMAVLLICTYMQFCVKIFLGGGYPNLVNYCVDFVYTQSEKRNIIDKLEGAFQHKISLRNDYAELIEKIDLYAEFIVAYHSKLLGYVAMYANDLNSKNAYITLIAVNPLYQGHYIGSRLLAVCETVALQRSMKTISLEVQRENKKVTRFYEKNGFVYQKDGPDGSIYMKKSIME